MAGHLGTMRIFSRELGMMRHLIVFLFASLLVFGDASLYSQEKKQVLTNADVVKMVQSGMSEDAIIKAIKTAAPDFELTDEAILALRQQKVTEPVVLAMIKRQWQMSSAKPKVHKAPAEAGPKWEVEVHGGAPWKFHQSMIGRSLPTAETYSLAGSGASGYWDKRVSSWYFGDGATLIGLSSSLDPALKESIVEPKGEMYGIRASRRLNSWLSAELTFDHGNKYSITDAGLAQVEAARAAFEHTWSKLDVPGNTPTTSVSTVSRSGGHQNFGTGAVVVGFPLTSRIRPYVTAGAGVFSGSVTSSVTLLGTYGGPSVQETDFVRMTFSQDKDLAFTKVLGGGIKIYLSPHWGIRVDARAYLYTNPIDTLVDAIHTNTSDGAWVVNATDGAGNIVEFLQKLSGPGLGAFTSLSGPAISGLKTSTGAGTQRQIPVTVGLFWRF
jgi:hypothetical protein